MVGQLAKRSLGTDEYRCLASCFILFIFTSGASSELMLPCVCQHSKSSISATILLPLFGQNGSRKIGSYNYEQVAL